MSKIAGVSDLEFLRVQGYYVTTERTGYCAQGFVLVEGVCAYELTATNTWTLQQQAIRDGPIRGVDAQESVVIVGP